MLDLLFQRRSIRKYKDVKVEKEKVEQLVQAALLAPSARSVYSQRFIVIDDKDLLNRLSKAREQGSSFLKDAPLAIVVLGDSSVIDVWTEDATISATMIQLVAESLGLGSCWIQIRNRQHSSSKTSEEYIQDILEIPSEIRVQCIIAIGYPGEEKPPRSQKDLNYDRVFYNAYRN
ncbi:MAG: NAD(P)H nitroreductase [Peptococcaceae bacterium]|nr:NAD(P)H nitroreductase [Peptococcaceae bacterium]